MAGLKSIMRKSTTIKEKGPDVEEFIPDEEGAEEEEEEEEEEPFISVFEILDAPRDLPEPIDLTTEHLKQIATELGLITLCWPEIQDVEFEGRTQFPESYLKNSDKEILLLLYAENFRRQFHHRFPNRKQLFLASDNECEVQKMVCTTIRPTTLPYQEIETWQDCASFVGDQLLYEPMEIPTLIPSRLYSPHTVCLRKSGQSYEIATVLCSLLTGLDYNAFVVSGYATRDITQKIMTRVDSPFKTEEQQRINEKAEEEVKQENKYLEKLKPPKDLRSKFLLAMAQREIDKENAEKARAAEVQKQMLEELEKPPFDDLYGLRVHAWVLLKDGEREIDEPVFIEPSTGVAHPLDSPLYCGIESIWNQHNYWVNMQDCSNGVGKVNYDFTDTTMWEHFLPGEPLQYRKKANPEAMYDDDPQEEILDEKHLDMPMSWSMRISIPHEDLKNRFPNGKKVTYYKRTLVEEYAPYVQTDGLTVRINSYEDLECTQGPIDIEERYENRKDCLVKVVHNYNTNLITEYFQRGREDGVKSNSFYWGKDEVEAYRVIEFYDTARYDGLAKVELSPTYIIEYYVGREDLFYYRHIEYALRGHPPPGHIEGPRRIVMRITEKFHRNEKKPVSKDIATREFALIDREIHLKFHYASGKVTASTRDFIKPPVTEMGSEMKFNPELTDGYLADIGATPPRRLQLYLLFMEQLRIEAKCLVHVREVEDEIGEFVHLRNHERAFPSLTISIYNREQNIENLQGLHERERQMREKRELEVEEDVDYVTPYLARLGNPEVLTRQQASYAREQCLKEFKDLLLARAHDIQRQFEQTTMVVQTKQTWYVSVQDTLRQEEEEMYFREVNALIFELNCLEIRLARHRDLSKLRYQALKAYVDMHPKILGLLPEA